MAVRHWHNRVRREAVIVIFAAIVLLAWLLTDTSIAVWPLHH